MSKESVVSAGSPEHPSKAKVVLQFSEEQYADLVEMRRVLGIGDHGGLVREAWRLFQHYSKLHMDGVRLQRLSADGSVEVFARGEFPSAEQQNRENPLVRITGYSPHVLDVGYSEEVRGDLLEIRHAFEIANDEMVTREALFLLRWYSKVLTDTAHLQQLNADGSVTTIELMR